MEEIRLSALQQGRPAQSREPIEDACYDFLDRLNVTYDRVDHDPAHHIETCHAVEQVLGAGIAKNLFLCNRQKTQFYLLILAGDKVFKTKYLSSQLGCARLSFGEPQDLEKYLGVQPGSASLLGLLNDKDCAVTLVLDSPILEDAYLGMHPCRNTSTLRVSMADVKEKIIPALGHEPRVVTLPEETL